MNARNYNMDLELQFKDAGAETATGITSVGGVDIDYIEVGVGRFEGVMVIDVSALDIVSNDELYSIIIEGSTTSGFASFEQLAMLELGATEVRKDGAIDSIIGRYEVPFLTEIAGLTYDFIRVRHVIAGTSTSIDYTAFVATKY